MMEVLPRIPLYILFRKLGAGRILPLNITASLTYRCNSRCKTCNIWKKRAEEFGLEEWDKTFRSLGRAPYWITFSGGEPFLRKDIVEICTSAYEHCRPGVISIPTNGLLSEIIPQKVQEILQGSSPTNLIINLSLDHIGEKHDGIRGVPGNFERALRTYQSLHALNHPNFALGIHTVISVFNVDDIPEIYEYISSLRPDSYIMEIAEERVELGTVGAEITPSVEKYAQAMDYVSSRIREQSFHGISKITQAFRLQYYELAKRILVEKRQLIPCYAGWVSAQIAPDGDVWMCCIRAQTIGNLREVNYDFPKIWFGEKAEAQRQSIKNGDCYCPLANVSYTNMLCDLRTLQKIGFSLTDLGLWQKEGLV